MPTISRDELAEKYLAQLPYPPYPVQEEALLSWFTAEKGVLVCAPTGTGKTLIAEAALFEALHTNTIAYYTTPLIALTEQKFREMQAAAIRWGFQPDDVGLVTGNRKVNPEARVLVVVAEILLNRLLHAEAFDFTNVSAVVMDEFHSFADPERGVVWELSLGMLPKHVRLLLLSATVGNAVDFTMWMQRAHGRLLDLVQGTERRVPLSYQWVPDLLLSEHLEWMANGNDESRRTPALVFCFNRDECWEVAEQLKGKSLLADGQQKKLAVELEKLDLTKGVGPKLKQILFRGVGVHHAGLLPKYKRIVEDLFQQKLLSVCVCTETLSAGINLPARSVVITSLLKGPPGKKKVIEPSAAHQMFGRAGRPQFDKEGFVYALAHEDDVKILRWKERYDQIPEDTKDPMLIRAKKAMKKKQPKRRETEQYWTKEQFEKLRAAPPGKLTSQGPLPWRLLAYLLDISPDVIYLRDFVAKRLLEGKHVSEAQKELDRRLMSLWAGGYVTLEPEPPVVAGTLRVPSAESIELPSESLVTGTEQAADGTRSVPATISSAAKFLLGQALKDRQEATGQTTAPEVVYRPDRAVPTAKLTELMTFRSVNPIYAMFLLEHLGKANREERIQAFESVLEIARSAAKYVRVPRSDFMPFGPLATEFLHPTLLQRGLATATELGALTDEEEEEFWDEKDRPRVLTLAEKLLLLFRSEFPDVNDVPIQACWGAGALLQFGGDFHKLVSARQATKQEGILFRHLLRFVLLLEEFIPHTPPGLTDTEWRDELRGIADQITASCREVDSQSTDQMLEEAHAAAALEMVIDVEVANSPAV
ncbi:MAG: DEAD/DEAH box helicase [Planctomycetaceae bacterium]